MNNSAHKLLDELLDEVKRSLIDQQIDKFKHEIFDKVEKQQKAVLEDVMQICDRIYKEVLAAAGPCPPKLVFLDHFFGENHCFRPFRPINTPKCYTWLESYGSPPYDGKKKKLFFSPCEASDF